MNHVFCNTGVLIRTLDSCQKLRFDVLSRQPSPLRILFEWSSKTGHAESSSAAYIVSLTHCTGNGNLQELAARLGGQSLYRGSFSIECPLPTNCLSWYRVESHPKSGVNCSSENVASFTRNGVAAKRLLLQKFDVGFPLTDAEVEHRLAELEFVFGRSYSEISSDAMYELWSKLHAGEDTPALDYSLSQKNPEQRRFVYGIRKNIRYRLRRSRFSSATARRKSADPFQASIAFGVNQLESESTETSQRAYKLMIARLLIRDFTLNDQSIEVLERRLIHGHSYEKVASDLSMKAASARSIVCRFRRFVR